jgi:hypothetical protein
MLMRRCTRRTLSWLAAIAFAWLQLATSAYACPPPSGPAEPLLAHMPNCDSMSISTIDTEQPNLCKAHCDNDKQRVTGDHAIDVPAVAPLDHASIWRAAGHASAALRRTAPLDTGPPAGTPPLFITFLVLRN